jgi:hypothetical protein
VLHAERMGCSVNWQQVHTCNHVQLQQLLSAPQFVMLAWPAIP